MGKGLLWIIVPFCSVFIIVGLGVIWESVRSIIQGCHAAEWPSTIGQIVRAKSTNIVDSEKSRIIEVRYSCRIKETSFEGSTIHPCYDKFNVEEAHILLEQCLREGVKVKVYFNPIQPDQSSLSTGFYSGSLSPVFGGLLCTLTGLCFLGAFWFTIAGNWDFASGITLLE